MAVSRTIAFEYSHVQASDSTMEMPEYQLWTMVLNTWIKDAKHCRTKERADIIRGQCFTRWTKHICDLIDLDYGFFRKKIEQLLSKRIEK
jgi:hypothetical protein